MSSASLNTASHQNLTRFSSGSIKELGAIVGPLVLSGFSTTLMSFFNRLFLSYYSIEALEASVSAMNLAFLFQIPCMRITTVAQIFVARFVGSHEQWKIGSTVWQMIWVSFLSSFLTLPFGLSLGSLLFQGTVVGKIALPYFSCLMFANFLFPLGGALGAFFVGQGRAKTITIALAVAHALQILLDKMLIFGIPEIILSQGAFGAVLSTIITQSLYCSILFCLFLKKKERCICGTNKWKLQPKILKECVCTGIPRAIGKSLILAAWAGSVSVLTHRGGDYLLAFSLGSSFYAVLACLNEGLGYGVITVASYYLGRKQHYYLFRVAKSALVMFVGILALLSLFFLFFPEALITVFFPYVLSAEQQSLLVYTCYGLWCFFLCDGLSWIGFGFLNAFNKMKFYLLYTALTAFFFNYLPIYFAYQIGNQNIEMLWWIMSFPCLASTVAYFFRIMKRLKILNTNHANLQLKKQA